MRGDELFIELAKKEPFSKMHPAVAAFFKDYLANEKALKFHEQYVINTNFPPYPSRAFDNLAEHFSQIGDSTQRKLYSVTLAVTNRCNYRCWHCYNAGRSQVDIQFPEMKKIVGELRSLSTVMVTLTGGEPLLRNDLEEIAGLFDENTCLNLNTTGSGLTPARARALRDSGLFGVGISLDSIHPQEHDRLRGKKGAFKTALRALETASQNGLYPYLIAVATRDFLEPGHFRSYLELAAETGAFEIHLLEPCPAGRLAGKKEVVLTKAEKEQILSYQKEIAQRTDLPILSTFLYIESPEAFGCGAGLTHLYIDGSGEVCPCNLVPLSFGNVTREPLSRILAGMSGYFRRPRTTCVGRTLSKYIDGDSFPLAPGRSAEICENHLPRVHPVPRFFKIRSKSAGSVGQKELQSAYDRIHEFYEEYWLTEAGKPVRELLKRLKFRGNERVFEAGCGTGYATFLIAEQLDKSSKVTAVDISKGMETEARRRARARSISNIRFITGDALTLLEDTGAAFDLVFSSWVLGYIPLSPFFSAAGKALVKGGRLAFIVHKENSPGEQLQVFWDIIAQNPAVLKKRVVFDFPRDLEHVGSLLKSSGLEAEGLWEGKIVFRYETPAEVLEHLLKSGAGTAFYDAVDPKKRPGLEKQFLRILADRKKSGNKSKKYEVIHDYISCIAQKP